MRKLLLMMILTLASALLLAGCPQKPTAQPPAATPKGPAAEAPKSDAPASPLAKAEDAGPADAKVYIRAFYPGNEKHKPIREYVLSLPAKYPGKVKARFVPFDSDEGFKEWQDAGLSCGGILINDKQSFTVKKPDGKKEEVTLKMFWGGEWTKEDLDAAVADEVAQQYPK